jgi:hypothetical protein
MIHYHYLTKTTLHRTLSTSELVKILVTLIIISNSDQRSKMSCVLQIVNFKF